MTYLPLVSKRGCAPRVMRFFSMTCGNEVTSSGAPSDTPPKTYKKKMLFIIIFSSICLIVYTVYTHIFCFFIIIIISHPFSMEQYKQHTPAQGFSSPFDSIIHMFIKPPSLFPSFFHLLTQRNYGLPGMLVDWMSWMSIYIIIKRIRMKKIQREWRKFLSNTLRVLLI